FGYHFMKQFCPTDPSFNIYDSFVYIVENNVDEIYCSISELRNNQITEYINFADNNLRTLKFIPDNKNIFSKKLTFEYYDYIPIFSLLYIPFHNSLNSVL